MPLAICSTVLSIVVGVALCVTGDCDVHVGVLPAAGVCNGLGTAGAVLGVPGDCDIGVLAGLPVCVDVKTALAAGISNGLAAVGVTGGVSGVVILTAYCNASGGGPLFDGV